MNLALWLTSVHNEYKRQVSRHFNCTEIATLCCEDWNGCCRKVPTLNPIDKYWHFWLIGPYPCRSEFVAPKLAGLQVKLNNRYGSYWKFSTLFDKVGNTFR